MKVYRDSASQKTCIYINANFGRDVPRSFNMTKYVRWIIIDHSEKSVFDSCQYPRVKRGNLSMKKSWFFRLLRYCVTMTCWCVLIFCLKISKVRETIIRVRLYTYIYVTNRILSGSCILYFFLFSYSVFKKKMSKSTLSYYTLDLF